MIVRVNSMSKQSSKLVDLNIDLVEVFADWQTSKQHFSMEKYFKM